MNKKRMRLFATRLSAFSPVMPATAAKASSRMPLTTFNVTTGGGGGAHPNGPPTYETFASRFDTTLSPNEEEKGGTCIRRPFSPGLNNGLPLPPPDLKRLERIALRRRLRQRIRSIFPPMSQKFAERLRLVAPHVLLFVATNVYGIVGAIIIYRIEKPHEQNHIYSHSRAIIDAQNELLQVRVDTYSANATNATIQEAIDKLISVSLDAFAEGVKSKDLELTRTNNTRLSRWNFHSAVYFTATVLTSVGYGHLVPISVLGRVFCIAYAMIGIPLTLITIADMAKFFSDLIMDFDIRRPKSSRSEAEESEQIGVLAESSFAAKMFVVSLLLFYMLGAALFFWLVKNQWDFVDSIYFCMITLVTIGFGDLVPEDEPHYFGWILFMFAGLILTTLTVDMCGSTGINAFHMFGRVDPRKIFSIFNKSHAKSAFEPHDIRIIPYIDEIIKNFENSVAKMSI